MARTNNRARGRVNPRGTRGAPMGRGYPPSNRGNYTGNDPNRDNEPPNTTKNDNQNKTQSTPQSSNTGKEPPKTPAKASEIKKEPQTPTPVVKKDPQPPVSEAIKKEPQTPANPEAKPLSAAKPSTTQKVPPSILKKPSQSLPSKPNPAAPQPKNPTPPKSSQTKKDNPTPVPTAAMKKEFPKGSQLTGLTNLNPPIKPSKPVSDSSNASNITKPSNDAGLPLSDVEATSNGTDEEEDKTKPDETKENEPMDTSNESSPTGKKRKHTGRDGKPTKRKRTTDHVSVSKNPLMKLNEMKPGLVYAVESQEGPSHNPTFIVSVEVNDQKFSGRGRSKQDAKHAAALSALASFVQFPDQSEISQMMPRAVHRINDFTTDSMDAEEDFSNNVSTEKFLHFTSPEYSPTPRKSKILKALAEFERKSPVMLLNELHPGCEFCLVDEMTSIPAHRFTMTVSVNGEAFEGSGQSKKLAKAAAARSALLVLYQIPFRNQLNAMHPANNHESPGVPVPQLKQAVADKIANMVYDRFGEVIVGFDENKKWKVLAGIVMTNDSDMEELTVIGLSTGTKCIGGEYISMKGASLNDCHAEIISRRCFKDYLYKQIEMHEEGLGADSILEKQNSGGFKLKPDIKFHLFISTAPCGDGRIFAPHEMVFDDGVDKHPNRKGRGLLRTKIEAGEGTIPVKPNEAFQTWDGIQGGQRLLTMSCSDKIARWNALGLQGTLLSLFVEPIYLESIILGSMYHEEHMCRAMGKRIEATLGPLPQPYQLNIPKLNLVTSIEARQPTKSPTYSVNWSHGLDEPEIVNGTTGKLHSGQISRLSKRSFFQRFMKIKETVTFLPGKNVGESQLYSEMKKLVTDYQEAKDVVLKAFCDASLGSWVKKPPEQDEFEIEL